MSARRKPLWRWEPLWYIVLFALVFATSAFQVTGPSAVFVIVLIVTVVVAVAILVSIVVGTARGRRNPDASGNLSSVDGLHLIQTAPTDAPPVAVADTKRHQSAIDAAAAFGGSQLSAVIVPGSTRWMGIRYRVSVQLVADERVFLAGYLPVESDAHWNDLLQPLRSRGAYLQVPATVLGTRRPYSVELDLSGAVTAVDIANAQSASS
jgi:hypothetical protein